MTGSAPIPDQSTPPKDDFEAAATIHRTLNTHTDTHRRTALPDNIEKSLHVWLDSYITRRRAETGVSPIASQLAEYFLDWNGLDWKHRVPTTNIDHSSDIPHARQSKYTTINATTPRAADKARSIMYSYGWRLAAIRSGDDHYAVELEFGPVQHDFEVLRRLLVAGLTETNALAFWATNVVDLRSGGTFVNDFLESLSPTGIDQVACLANALDTPSGNVATAAQTARDTLADIDPGLPQLLEDGTGGHPLPDECWSAEELAHLERVQ